MILERVNKVRKNLVKLRGRKPRNPLTATGEKYEKYEKLEIYWGKTPVLPKSFVNLLLMFVDQSYSIVGKVVASRIDRSEISTNEQSF